MAGAAAGMLLALNPEHRGGGSVPHAIWATISVAGMALWPAGAWQRVRRCRGGYARRYVPLPSRCYSP